MITDRKTVKSLAGKSWNDIYVEMLTLAPVSNFNAYICVLIESMDKHEYSMTAEQGFSWLFIASRQYLVRNPESVTAYKRFLELLVNSDYKPYPGMEVRRRLYQLFNQNAFTTPTMAAVLLNLFLCTGNEQKAKPNLNAYMLFAWIYQIMPVFYRQDVKPTETTVRDSIFMALPEILGKFSN